MWQARMQFNSIATLPAPGHLYNHEDAWTPRRCMSKGGQAVPQSDNMRHLRGLAFQIATLESAKWRLNINASP